MPENSRPTDCERFEDWMHDTREGADLTAWVAHLDGCAACREQWRAHRLLVAVFVGEAVPEISLSFEAGLERKLRAAVRVRPLRGWRLAALGAYALAAVVLLRWIFAHFPPPAIDPSSPWATAGALILAPLSLWLVVAATRLLPARRFRARPALGS
jgi:hypothetical protein